MYSVAGHFVLHLGLIPGMQKKKEKERKGMHAVFQGLIHGYLYGNQKCYPKQWPSLR